MSTFHAYTTFKRPGLHVWREDTNTRHYLNPTNPLTGPGWVEFKYDFEPSISNPVRFMLFELKEDGKPGAWEKNEHQRTLPRDANGNFADDVWFSQDSGRVLLSDPKSAALQAPLRIHLISRARYRPSQLYVWNPEAGTNRRVDQTGEDQLGPFFDVQLQGTEQRFFLFKFIRRPDPQSEIKDFEPDRANRFWCAADGAEIWTHSEAPEVTTALPAKKRLRVHYRQEFPETPLLHYGQHNAEASADAAGVAEASNCIRFDVELYTGLDYGFKFHNPPLPNQRDWELGYATRNVRITGDTEFWTLEGDSNLFTALPSPNRQLELTVSAKPPFSKLGSNLFAHVWVNRARGPIQTNVPVDAQGRVSIATYADVTTSARFHDDRGNWETCDRHAAKLEANGASALQRFVVLERSPLLASAPPADLFKNPPFRIRRPGAYEENGAIHFIVHAPGAGRARVIGEWTSGTKRAAEMRCTEDGAYWWARVPVTEILSASGKADYHGMEYKFLFNDADEFQDPAAGWMPDSWNKGPSWLINHSNFQWTDENWRRPGWDYLNIYQIHVARFTNRHQNEPPLRRVAREIDSQAGYLRDLGVTAILLLPLNEVGTQNSWGYDPAFFYAIEHSYGGPDALKELVDACHRRGLAVLIDVVFNHAGSTDNILWQVAQESFFDGDTAWGAMINYDHPQCRHFFAQNLVYLAKEFHIDGFRLDHTATITHSNVWDPWSGFVRKQGSGGGWEFLHAIRNALHTEVDPRCMLMAEHLPNEWALTNYGGPMDTQWCDDFHDRMVEACKRQFGMSRLAEAFRLSHTSCQQWYNVTNYPESHDEVGNVRDRVTFVAGWGQGYRMSKVAATATLLSRGIPMFFMGAESGEDKQFEFGSSASLDLDLYQSDRDKRQIREWWRTLSRLRVGNAALSGPSPLDVRFAEGQLLAFTRGDRPDYFVVLNFGGWSGFQPLSQLNLPDGTFRELWNSTWPAFAVGGEKEDEHTNWGRDARITRGDWLHVPDYGAVVLERVG